MVAVIHTIVPPSSTSTPFCDGLLHFLRFLGSFLLGPTQPPLNYITSLSADQWDAMTSSLNDFTEHYAIHAKEKPVFLLDDVWSRYYWYAKAENIDWTDFIQCGALKEALRCYLCQLQPQELAELFIQEIRKPVTLLFRHTPTESDEDLYGWLPPECLRHYLLLRVTRQDGRVVLANRVWHRDEPTVEAWLDRNRLWIFQQVEHGVERDSLSERLPDPKQYSRMEFDENAVVNEPWSFDPGYLDGDELPLIFDD